MFQLHRLNPLGSALAEDYEHTFNEGFQIQLICIDFIRCPQ